MTSAPRIQMPARHRPTSIVGLAIVFALMLGGQASGAPLPGSTYDSGDGNQDTQVSGDWQSAQAQDQVKISRDRNDDCFIGGVKELSPDGWAFNNSAGGCTPGKSNIRVAYVNPETTAATSFSHFAFFRNDTTGNTFLTFELNQTPSTWVNSKGTTIPCRSNGDILLSFEVGGSSLESLLYRWTGDNSGPPSCPHGANGTFVGSGVIPGSRSQGTMNSAQAIANHVDPASFGASFPANSFGEAAIDIPAVLQAMGQSPCVAFLQMQVHSRSSSSISSAMIDYTEPVAVNIQSCAAIGQKYSDVNANGVRDAGETGLGGFEFYDDANDDGDRDAGEPTGSSDASGFYRIVDLPAGSHRIREVAKPGWRISAPASALYTRSTITGGNSIANDFANVGPATATGTRFHDLDNDGVRGAGELGQAGWTYYADLDGDGVKNAGEPSGSSDATGAWTIDNVPAGSHTIREVPQAGWNCSAPAGCTYARTFASGATVVGLEFGGWTAASVGGNVFEDFDGDGAAFEAGDVGQSSWQVYLDANANNAWDLGEIQTTTVAGGGYTLTGVAPGAHSVRVTSPPAGWYCTRPGVTAAACERALTLTSGQLAGGQDFGFTRTATVSGTVFDDADNSATRGPGESAWATATTIFADLNANGLPDAGEPSVSTSSGTWTLAGIPAGTVAIRQASGAFSCTTPAGCAFTPTLTSGQTLSGYEFGNYVATSKAISGTVWLDANANNVKDASETTGVAGITVYADNDKNASFNAGDTTGVTNSAGAYALTTTANGNVPVRIRPDSLVPAGPYTCSFPAGCSINVTGLGNGQSYTGRDFGVYGPASLSGRLVHDLNANGVADAGETAGLAGRTIYDDADNDSTFDAIELSTTTAADGAYTLPNLNPGLHRIRMVTAASSTCSAPGGCAHVVTMASANISGLDFLNWTPATVSGTVFEDADADGAAREGGELALGGRTVYLDANNNLVKDITEISVLSNATTGTYAFNAVVPGVQTVRQVLPIGWVQDTPASAHTVAAVSGGSYAARDFSSHTTATISGRVFDDADFQGDPFESGDSGLVGRTVYLDTDGDAQLDGGETTAITNGSGNYTLAVAPGSYSVRTVADNADRACASPSGCAHSITATSGTTYALRDFGSYVGATVSGTLFEDADADGRARELGEPPARGLRVYLDANANGTRDASEPTTLTDADGGYGFRGVTAQSWGVRLDLSGGWTCDSPIPPCAYSVVLTSGATQAGKDFGVHTTATISGHLYTDRDNDGGPQVFGENDQPGGTVYLDSDGDGTLDGAEPQTVADELGDYSFSGLQPGTYRIRHVLPAGWQPSIPADGLRTVTVVSGQTKAAQDFSSWTTAVITGRVFEDTDADGAFPEAGEPGISPRTVYLDTTPDGAFDGGEPSAVAGVGGSFTFAGLAPGSYTVRPVVPATWTCSYPAGCSAQLVVEAGEVAQEINFGLWTNGTLAGTVYSDANGDGDRDIGEGPLANRVVFVDLDGDTLKGAGEPSQTTDVDGAYAFHQQPGTYTVRQIPAAGWVCTTPPCAQTATIASGQTSGPLDFGNQLNAATVSGRVAVDNDADGNVDPGEPPLGGWTVFADLDGNGRPGPAEPFDTTAPDGTYSLADVTPGTRTIRVDRPAGWTCSSPCSRSIALTSGSTTPNIDFALYQAASIGGRVYEDYPGQSGLGNRTVELDAGADGSVEDTTTTDVDGAYAFTGRTPGSYRVTVVVGAGNLCTAPASCRWDRTVPSGTTSTGNDFALYHVPVADLSLTKSAPANVDQNQTFDYTLVATNHGPDAAQSVTIVDTLPSGLQFVAASPACAHVAPTVTCTIGTIANGDSASRTITVRAIDAGSIANTAGVSSPTGDPTPANDSDTAGVSVAPVADLDIDKTGPANVVAGELATYTLTARNNGPSTATNVVLRDTLPAGMTFDAATSNPAWTQVASSPDRYEIAIGDVANGLSASRDIVVRAQHTAADSTRTDIASVRAATTDDTPANNTDSVATDVGPSANLKLTKTVDSATIAQGEDAVYTLRVTNDGPSAATNVVVTDALPAGVTFVSLSAPGAFSCTTPAVGSSGQVTCSATTLADSAVATITITVRGAANGTQVNTATVSSPDPDPDPSDDSATATVEVGPTADLSIVKTSVANVTAGGRLTYTLTAHNAGPSAATGVTVVDVLPAGMTYVGSSGSQGSCAFAAGTVTCALGGLADGDDATATITARATFALAGTTVPNSASISGDQNDDDPSDNASTRNVDVGPAADLVLTDDAPAHVPAGGQLLHSLLLANDGPQTAVHASFTVTLPAGATFVSASSTQGSCTAAGQTVTCAIGDLPAGAAVQVLLTVVVADGLGGQDVTTTALATSDTTEIDPATNSDGATTAVDAAPPAPPAASAADARAAPAAPPASATAPGAAGHAAGDLTVAKTADDGATAVFGRSVAFTIRVANASDRVAHGVVAVDRPSAAATLGTVRPQKGRCDELTCRLGELAAGEVVLIHVTMTPRKPGSFENAVVVSSDDGEREARDNRAVAAVKVVTAKTRLSLRKAVDRRTVRAGSTVWFTITARNIGPDTAADVRVCDSPAFNTTFVTARGARFSHGRPCWTTASLAPGAHVSYRVEVRVSGTTRASATTDATVTSSNSAPRRARKSVRVVARRVLVGAGVTG